MNAKFFPFKKCRICKRLNGTLCKTCLIKKSSSGELDGMVDEELKQMKLFLKLKKRFENRQKRNGKSKLNVYFTM